MSIFALKMFLLIYRGTTMSFLNKIKNLISKKREAATALFFQNSTTKQSITSSCTLKLSSKTEELKKQINEELKIKIKKYINAPEKLLQYVQLKGIKVYRIKNAEKILAYLKEEEGFITPLKGIKAVLLNLILNHSFGFKTKEMIVLDSAPVEIYTVARALHKYYGFKKNLPGYDYKSQETFKKVYSLKRSGSSALDNCSIKDILACKEALARDVESIKFTVELSHEYENAKKALKKLKESSANI